MTVKQAFKKLETEGALISRTMCNAMYNIAFVNSDGQDDETQFDIHVEKTLEETAEELSSLFADFCKENGIKRNSVYSVCYAGPIV